MKKTKTRLLAGLMAALCLAAVSPSASAAGYYASDESGHTRPPSAIESISVSQESVSLPAQRQPNKSEALTPDGNLSLIDDIFVSNEVITESDVQNKQFITVQSKNGNYFYLVIDRSGDTENVYLLNLVDEADLMALMEDGTTNPTTIPTCSCTEKCAVGTVNTDCEICKTEMNRCAGIEAKPDPQDTEEMDEPATEEPQQMNLIAPIMLVILLIVGAGAGIYFYTTQKKKPVSDGTTDLDEYDYGEAEAEYEEEEIYENEDDDTQAAEDSSAR